MRRRRAESVAAGEAAGEEAPIPAAAAEETPLEAAPATPEAAPEALLPAAGETVAAGVEHLGHALRLGETGFFEGLAPDDPLGHSKCPPRGTRPGVVSQNLVIEGGQQSLKRISNNDE